MFVASTLLSSSSQLGTVDVVLRGVSPRQKLIESPKIQHLYGRWPSVVRYAHIDISSA